MISDRTLERVLRSSRAVALYGDLVRLAIAGGLLLAIATALVYYGQLVLMVITDYKMNDFGKFYYSAQEYLAGRDMYGPTPATSHRFPDGSTRQFLNMNPPHFQLLMVPFALLPRHIAFCLWWVLSLTSLAVSVRLVRHELNWRWTPARLLWFAAAATTSAITGTVVATGQLTFLLLLPLTLAWIYARRGRWTAAAVALGLLASIKPFLGMFALYFIVTRRHRSLQVMLLAALAATLAGLIVAGAESYSRWFESLAAVEWSWAPMNA